MENCLVEKLSKTRSYHGCHCGHITESCSPQFPPLEDANNTTCTASTAQFLGRHKWDHIGEATGPGTVKPSHRNKLLPHSPRSVGSRSSLLRLYSSKRKLFQLKEKQKACWLHLSHLFIIHPSIHSTQQSRRPIPPFTGGAETGNNQVQKWWVSPREVGERAKSKWEVVSWLWHFCDAGWISSRNLHYHTVPRTILYCALETLVKRVDLKI